MYKLVVLCALLVAAAAEPGAIFAAPLTYSATVVAPATTTISKQASSVVHPSPLLYSTPLAYTHFIKKRSAPLAISSYIAPTTYISAAPVATSYSAPLIHTTPYLAATPLAPTFAYSAAHLIKKRSAISVPYLAPITYAATAPRVAVTYAAAPVYSTPLVSAPIAYTHLIKKRSAPAAYIAPTSYSSQSRIDIHGAPLVTSYTSYATPFAYSSPIAFNHVI